MPDLWPILEKLHFLKQKIDSNSEPVNSFRVFHGRGKVYSGLEFVTIDYFYPIIFVILFKEPPDHWLKQLIEIIQSEKLNKIKAVIVQYRYLPGDPSEIVFGELPDVVFAQRDQLRFQLQLVKQQNIGFFLDTEPARLWLEKNAAGRRILNLFAYTCSFSVVAAAAGAEKVVNVDMSSTALNIGRINHQLNGLDKKLSQFMAENILKSWSRIKRAGPYDLVILDPPSFQKGSFDSVRDYPKLVKRLSELMPRGGLVLSCLNNPDLDASFLKEIFSTHCPEANFCYALSPSADFPDVDMSRQLKMLIFSLDYLNSTTLFPIT